MKTFINEYRMQSPIDQATQQIDANNLNAEMSNLKSSLFFQYFFLHNLKNTSIFKLSFAFD